MADVNGPRTMRIESCIKHRRVIVLIDSGSTHNFVSQEIAKKLQLMATTVEPFKIRVVNRESLECDIMYKDVPLRLQVVAITTDLFVLPLKGLDVVLGVQWLQGLGKITAYYA